MSVDTAIPASGRGRGLSLMSTDLSEHGPTTFVVPSSAAPVLHVDPPRVELAWVRKGEVNHAATVLEGDVDNEQIVYAAKDLVANAKIGGQGVVLCLGAPLFDSRQVLLAELDDDDAYAVLSRRAANSIGVSLDEGLFWAQRCATPLVNAKTTEATWLVHTRKRSEHFDLQLRLRRAGIYVRRTVAGWDVLQNVLERTDASTGRILVSNTGRTVFAHLFRGADLVQESRLPIANFQERDDSHVNVVQDVRQLAAFWSKGSRGAPLQSVELFGFSEVEVEKMRPALAIAAQGADVRVIAVPEGDTFDDVRSRLLDLFLTCAPRSRDLSLRLPPRRSRVAGLTLVLSLIAAGIAWKLTGYWTEQIDGRLRQIDQRLAGTEGVEEAVATRDAFLAARDNLAASLGSLQTISHRGLPLSSALDHVYGSLGRIVDVRQLTLEHMDDGTRVVMEARVPDEVGAAARRLERLRRAAQQDAAFRDVEVHPASRVPDADRGEALTFTFRGTFVGEGA